jgi:sigma-B regulation protein RsbU (phosphoserine phosphatase)
MPALVIRSRAGLQQTIELSPRPITVGRADTCDVVLPRDAEVSREHAMVWLDEAGRVLVADKSSKNGTRVDAGEPFHNTIRPALRWIRIGEYELEIVGARPVAPSEGQVFFAPDVPSDSDNTAFFPSTRSLDLNQQRLALLMSLTERIGGAFEPKQLLQQALDACCDALGFERGLIALKTARGDPELPVTRNLLRDETGAYKVSRTLINRALVEGQRAVVNNPAVDLANNLSESLVRFPICSALCVPILHRARILGVIYGDRITRATTYTPEDVDFLAAIAQQVGVGLENVRLFQSYLETEKLKLELRQARAIQEDLFPSEPLRAGRVILAGHNEPSEAVGGDYYDYFDLGNGRVGLIIADVTGHGLAAALVMAHLKGAVRVALTAEAPLPEVAAGLNRTMCGATRANVFITAILGRIDTATGVMEYVNAGHPGPLLLRHGHVRPEADGLFLPLGIEASERYSVQRIEPDRDLEGAVFYTDGLIEAADPAGHLLSVAPVEQALAGLADRRTEAVLSTLLSLVRQHLGPGKNADDLTLMAVQYA